MAVVRCDLLRLMVEHPVVSGVAGIVLAGGIGVLAALVPGPTLDLAPMVSLPTGTALFVAGLLVLARLRRRAESDGIRLPGT